MTADSDSINTNSTRLLELLLKVIYNKLKMILIISYSQATRTSDEKEVNQWWTYFYENLDSNQINIKQKKSYFSLVNRQVSTCNKIIQVLAQQLDKENLSVLHYVAYHNNLFICRKLADVNCGMLSI